VGICGGTHLLPSLSPLFEGPINLQDGTQIGNKVTRQLKF